jgi:hypothetical protein
VERWPVLLRGTVQSHLAQPFVPGKSDCALLFADAVRAVTGFDPIADGRVYTTLQDGLRNLRRAGHQTMADFIASCFPEIHPSEAQRGDLGMLADPDNGAVTSPLVILGADAATKSMAGPVIVSRGLIVRAFAV